jgi:hypothetical protein
MLTNQLYQYVSLFLMSLQILVTGYLAYRTFKLTERDVKLPEIDVEAKKCNEDTEGDDVDIYGVPESISIDFEISNTGRGDARIDKIEFDSGISDKRIEEGHTDDSTLWKPAKKSYKKYLTPGDSTSLQCELSKYEDADYLLVKIHEGRLEKEIFAFEIDDQGKIIKSEVLEEILS